MKDTPVECCRCRHKHTESARIQKPSNLKVARDSRLQMTDSCCPRCGARTFYDLTPQEAWCWASGLIEVGDQAPTDGAIVIASGPKASLKVALEVLARHGQGESNRQLLVPGVPEAATQKAKADALAAWLEWCAIRGRRWARQGITWAKESSA